MSEMVSILKVFEDNIRNFEQHIEAELGEDVDELLGILRENINNSAPTSGERVWYEDIENFSSTLELMLQRAAIEFCQIVSTHFKQKHSIDPATLCVRLTVKQDSSPFYNRIDGFHYIVIPVGFIKTVEGIFRAASYLAVLGARTPKDEHDYCVETNYLNGRDIESALQEIDAPQILILGQVLADNIVYLTSNWIYSYPEDIATSISRVLFEVIGGGIYSSDKFSEDAFRLKSSHRSKLLTRLVLLYSLFHEVAHALIELDDCPVEELSQQSKEKMCDLLAATIFPIYVKEHTGKWSLSIDGSTELMVGIFGFFSILEFRELAELTVGVTIGELREGTEAFDNLASRLDLIKDRVVGQKKVLAELFKDEPALLKFLYGIYGEIQSLPIAVQMLASRLISKKKTTFCSHFYQRNDP